MNGSTGVIVGVLLTLLASVGVWLSGDWVRDPVRDFVCDCPGPLKVARATLVEARQEEKLLVRSIRFDARAIAETPILASKPGMVPDMVWNMLKGRKTLVIPVEVGYAVDLSRMTEQDLSWDDAALTLTVMRPPVQAQQPQPDATHARYEVDNGLVIWWRGAEARLDETVLQAVLSNAALGASGAKPKAAAEQDADTVVARTFRRPLHAAGFPDARVIVKRKEG